MGRNEAVGHQEEPRIVSYPIPHFGEGKLHIFGSGDADQLVFMCPGFPDDHRSFTPLAKRLSAECNCLVGVICLPGYEYENDANRKLAANGYTFDDWVATIREAVKAILLESSKPRDKTRLTGIFHDWGVVAGLNYANQMLEGATAALSLDQIVLLDVLVEPSSKGSPPISAEIIAKFTPQRPGVVRWCLNAYQVALALNFWLFQTVPRLLMFCFMYITEKTLKAANCFPVSEDDYEYLHMVGFLPVQLSTCAQIGYMCYPYRNGHRLRAAGTSKSFFDLAALPQDLSGTPVLFIYGGSKVVPLHDPASMALLEQCDGKSRAVRIDTAGHWLHQTHPDECFQEIQQFIQEE